MNRLPSPPSHTSPPEAECGSEERLTIGVLVVDHHGVVRQGLRILLESDPDIEIVAVTCALDDVDVPRACHGGAMGGMLKDARPDELARAISEMARDAAQERHPAATCLLRGVHMPESPEKLTERETEVLKLVAKGLSNRSIAHRLVVSEKTVKTHVSSVLSKLRLPSRTQAALFALRVGLVSLDDAA
jgi:DNA-binding NarL/FixJ family response regulator